MRLYRGKLTMDERLFIHCYYTTLSRTEIANYLNIPLDRVKSYLDTRKMTLTKEQIAEKNRRVMMKRNNSSQFDDFIRANYLTMPTKTLGTKIGKSGGFVWARLKFLGLKIPDKIIEKFKKESHFKKGQISHNKGKKMSAELYSKVSHTFFNKGNVPHNAKKNGDEVLRLDSKGQKYIMVKVPEKSRLDYKHRILWEQHNGPIPKGCNVQFKDGNTLNCVIENLYLIDRKSQLIENIYKPEALAKRFLKISENEIDYMKEHNPGLLNLLELHYKLKREVSQKDV